MRCSDRRSQYIVANFIEEPQPGSPPSPESDPEACVLPLDFDEALSDGSSTPSSTHTIRPEDGLVDNLQWDEDVATPIQNLNSYQWNAPIAIPTRPPGIGFPQERTPLIRKANSFHIPTAKMGYGSTEGKKWTSPRTKPPRKIRPLEPTQKRQEVVATKPHLPLGRSTFGQTVSKMFTGRNLICIQICNSSCSILSLCSSASGCCRNPSPSHTRGGVAVLYYSFSTDA